MGGGQRLLLALEDAGEPRKHEGEQEHRHAHRHGGDDAGVDARADHHLAGLEFLPQVGGDAVEHPRERTAHLRGPDHADVERSEELRMLRDGLRELLAALDVALDLHQDRLELRVAGLLGDAVERLTDADARADHDRELRGEVEDLLLARAARPVEHRGEVLDRTRSRRGGELDDMETLAAQHRRGGRGIGGREGAFDHGLSVAGLIAVLRHACVPSRLRRRASVRASRGGRTGRSRPRG